MGIRKRMVCILMVPVISFAGWASWSYAQNTSKKVAPFASQCPEGQVWEEPHVKPNGQMAPGFCRPETREGFRWEPARKGPDGKLHRGYWIPMSVPINREWVPGHYDKEGNWVEGRFTHKKGPSPLQDIFGPKKSPEKGTEKPFPFGR